MPDTNQTTPPSEFEKQLAAEVKLAAFRKDIAQAKEAEAKAEKQMIDNRKANQEAARDALKAPDIKALEGKITSSGNFVETQVLANERLDDLLNELVADIFADPLFKDKDVTFILYNPTDFPNLELYIALKDQITALKSLLESAVNAGQEALKEEEKADAGGGFAPMMVGLAAASLLRTAADIFSLFKTNESITNHDIAADEGWLVSGFRHRLKKDGKACDLYYPAAMPVKLLIESSKESSNFLTLFTSTKSVDTETIALQKRIEDELAEIELQLSAATEAAAKLPLEARKQKLGRALPLLQSATGTFSQAESALLAVDPNTRLSTRAVVLRAEKLAGLLQKDNAYVIKLSAKLNGSTQVKEGLFRTTSLLHSGGAQLNCLIFSNEGKLVFSDSRQGYEPYQEVKKIGS